MPQLVHCYTVRVHHFKLIIKKGLAGILLLCITAPLAANTLVHEVLFSNERFNAGFNDQAVFSDPGNEPAEITLTGPDALASDVPIGEVHMSAMGKDMLLQLQPSRFNQLTAENGHIDNGDNDVSLRLYQGSIAGDNQSWVRLTQQNGKLNGHLFYYGTLYQLEHRDYLEKLNTTQTVTSEHILFEATLSDDRQNILGNAATFTDNIELAPTYPLSNQPVFHFLANQANSTLNNAAGTDLSLIADSTANGFGTQVTRAVRVGIVVDSRFHEAHQNRGLARALSIMSAVDAIYQSQLGIAVIVEGIRVYEDPQSDPMRDKGGTVSQILANFRDVRSNDERLPADLTLVHLFTGHRDPSRVIGLGWISTACRLDGYDLSVSTPFPFDTLLAAHEIAHNLGAVHDDDTRCAATLDNKPNTLMWPEISGLSTAEFSSCSINFMQAAKQANCNLDNINASIAIRTYPSSEELRRAVVVEVTNHDQFGRATQLASTTTFPTGTQFSEISAGCVVINTSVECNHGTVRANANSSISLSATLASRSQENVVSSVTLLNASDVDTSDNRVSIQLLDFMANSGEATAADLPLLRGDVNAADESGDFITRIGSVSSYLLLVLSLLSYLRIIARQQQSTP